MGTFYNAAVEGVDETKFESLLDTSCRTVQLVHDREEQSATRKYSKTRDPIARQPGFHRSGTSFCVGNLSPPRFAW